MHYNHLEQLRQSPVLAKLHRKYVQAFVLSRLELAGSRRTSVDTHGVAQRKKTELCVCHNQILVMKEGKFTSNTLEFIYTSCLPLEA